ncbi:MAG: hypothetical protein WCY54_01420 [Syntrophales bacterium]
MKDTERELRKERDPFEIGTSLMDVYVGWVQNDPAGLNRKLAELAGRFHSAWLEEWDRFSGFIYGTGGDGESGQGKFREFVGNYGQLARKFHGVFVNWTREFTAGAPGVDDRTRLRALFWADRILQSVAPANFFWTNPGAVQKFFETEGDSLLRGLENRLADLRKGEFWGRMVDSTAFRIGENLAATPGSVVFRNELMELIQYEPATDETYSVPIVFIQPWVNKYYVFDLCNESSFVRYMTRNGYTVFITSWKNPDSDMAGIRFDDYMLSGALKAVEVAGEICGGRKVHAAGYCIGGTVLASMMAWANRTLHESRVPVVDWTLFSALTDFSEPGELGVFMSEPAIQAIEGLMQKKGYLDKFFISSIFRLLGSESLIWRNSVQNYLYGGRPPRSDMLFWNNDGTRLPEAMCSFYLRKLYLENKLAEKDGISLGGAPIDLGKIRQPLYAVGAQQDHICPWRGTFLTCRLTRCPVRYVLTSEGHITGIVNPPSERSRRKYWAGDYAGENDAETWLSGRDENRGSWWTDWLEWMQERSLPKTAPPAMGSSLYPVLGKSPGKYVLQNGTPEGG